MFLHFKQTTLNTASCLSVCPSVGPTPSIYSKYKLRKIKLTGNWQITVEVKMSQVAGNKIYSLLCCTPLQKMDLEIM